MTEPTAEARAAELVALIADEVRPSLNAYQLNAIEPMLALALHAYRQAGVEQAEKERDEARAEIAHLDQAGEGLGRYHDETIREHKQHITTLEAELARAREGRDGWRKQTETEQQRVIRHIHERDALRARLDPARLEKVAREIAETIGDREDTYESMTTEALAILQHELGVGLGTMEQP